MELAEKIAKNSTYLTVSSLLQKLLSFWYFAFVANKLGDSLNNYSFALSFTGIFVIIMNFGFIPVLTREGSKHKDTLEEQLNVILGIKIVLTLIIVVAMLIVFHGLNAAKGGMPWQTITLVYLATAIIIFDTFRSILLAVFRARQEMQYEAIGQLIYQVIVVILGVIVLVLGWGAYGIMLALIAASLWFFGYAVYLTRHKARLRLRPRLDMKQLWPLLVVSAPFALADAFFKLNGSLDTVMLGYLSANGSVAWHTIAQKLTITLTVIPGAIATAFFPAMSRAFIESTQKLQQIFQTMMKYILIISVPISVGTYILADQIIRSFFPNFLAAIQALQIFAVSIIFLFINYPIGNILNAANKQTANTMNMGIALVVNIVLNFILIPKYTYLGAAIAAVVSTVTLVILGFNKVRTVVPVESKILFVQFIKTSFAAIIMGTTIYALPFQFPILIHSKLAFFLLSGIGSLIYFITLYLVKGFTKAELQQLYHGIFSRFSKD